MGFGRKPPRGSLVVFTVADEKEAQALLTQACPTDRVTRQFYAEELVEDQTLHNLARFSHRLAMHHELLVKSGQCRCKGESDGGKET